MPDVSEDALLGGRVRLLQPTAGHRAGTDAVLLARFAGAVRATHAVDLGSGSGAIGLMLLASRPELRVTFVEREPDLAALCRRNVALNGAEARATVVGADVFVPSALGAEIASADLVVTNPPFFETRAHRASPERGRRTAHAMAGGTLAEWLATAAGLLAARGRLMMVHRADHLTSCFAAASPRFGSFEITPVYPRAGRPAARIIFSAVKGGRAPTVLAPPLVLHDGAGFTDVARALHGEAEPG